MNNKGEIRIRHVLIVMILVSAMMMFASMFIGDMANSYDNTDMASEWGDSSMNKSGFNMYNIVESNVTSYKNASESGVIDEMMNSLGGIGVAIKATGTVVSGMIYAPSYLGDMVKDSLFSLGVPSTIADLISGLIIIFFWTVVIIGIIVLALRGGKF